MLEAKDNLRAIIQEGDAKVTKTVASYLHHLRSITIIRQMIPLIIASQQHRGAHLALMEGDNYFENKETVLEEKINNQFASLLLLNKELSYPVLEQDIERLYQEWNTVRNWSGGPALESFNLHSHFIEQLMRMVWSITEKTNYFLLSSQKYIKHSQKFSSYKDVTADDALLVQFILHEIPELIELIARIRGLATHTSVIGVCDDEHESWLEYLLQQLNQKKEKFRVLIRSLQIYALRDLPSLIDLEIQDVGIVQLIQFVDNNLLRQDKVAVDGHIIFTMTTNIINSYTEVVKQGLDYIQNKVHRELDDWHFDDS